MNVDRWVIAIICLSVGLICFICTTVYTIKKEKLKWWLDICMLCLRNLFITFGAPAFFLYMTIYFFGSIVVVIESETEHYSYMHFGETDEFLIDLEPRNVYVFNKMERTILVHSLPSDNGLTKDWVVIKPNQVGKVRRGPMYYFDEDKPTFYRGNSLKNAVDYYEH